MKKWAIKPIKLAAIRYPTFLKAPLRSSWEPMALVIKENTAKGVRLKAAGAMLVRSLLAASFHSE